MKRANDLLYSSGGLGSSLVGSVFSSFLIFFYVDTLKMPSDIIGLVMVLYGVWNAINDPLLGHVSDRTRSKWGRRKPYILFGSLPLAVIFAFVWVPPFGILQSLLARIIYFILIIVAFDTLYTLVVLNWSALFPEMYKSQEERTRVSSIRQIFNIIGNILGVALPPIVYTAFGWEGMGVLFAVIGLISFGLSYLGAREDPTYSEGKSLSFGKAIGATFKNKSFLVYVIAAMFLQLTFVLIQAGIPFYCKYVLKIPDGFQVSLVLGLIFISAMVFVRFWSKKANQYGSKKIYMTSVILYGLALIPFWFIKSLIGGMITSVLLGVGLSGLLILLEVMLSDIIDEDELNTGARREGMYFGINGFMVRLGISIQSLMMGYVLKISGYDANLGVGQQPEGALIGIKSLITVVPLVCLVVVFLVIRKYPLYGEKLKSVKEQFLKLHNEKS